MALFAPPYMTISDDNGHPISGGGLKFYRTGTMDPINVYSNVSLSVSLGSTVTADAAGRCVAIYLDDSVSYRCRVVSASGVLIRDIDPIPATADTDSALLAEGKCLIIPIQGQSLTIGEVPQVTTQQPSNLYMPVGGCEAPSVNLPAPLSINSRPLVPSNFASFVPHAAIAGYEALAPGVAFQLQQAGYSTVLAFASGVGGTSLSMHLAGGSSSGASGPYHANMQMFLRYAVKWAAARGLEPVIVPIFSQGHADADLLYDGGGPGVETTQAEYMAGLTKLYRDMRLACTMALGEPWNGTVWIDPFLTGQGSSYTLTGRKAVAAAQLEAVNGGVPGMRMLPPHSQFALLFESDLIHPTGPGFRYRGELFGAAITEALAGRARTVPYMVSKAVISGTQCEIEFSERVEISSLVAEASTAGVQGGLEAYTAGGVQIPLTAAAQGSNAYKIVVTMASTATLSKIRNGLAQETTGTVDKMPRTRVASTTALGTAIDGTVMAMFSPAQEIQPMAYLIGSYRFSTLGYDAANTRLIDESGNGNHLPLLAGTPDFTGSYSSKTAFKMHGTAYFGGPNILQPDCWSAISVLHPKILAGESLNYIWGSGRAYADADPGHESALLPFEGDVTFVLPTTAQFIAHRARITETDGVTGTDVGGSVTHSTGFTSDAWNVVTDVWNGETSQIKKRFGTAAWGSSAITQHYQAGMMEELRLGYRPSGLTVASNHLGCLRIDIYSGDYSTDDPTGYAARISALAATPDL